MKKLSFILILLGLILLFGCNQAETTEEIEQDTPKEIEIQDETPEEPIIEDEPEEMEEEHIEEPDAVTAATIAINVIAEHNTEDDCWIVYEGKVYNYTDAPRHPNMDKVFFAYCGKISGFEEGAKNRHSNSNEDRVSNFGTYVGEVGK